MRRRDIKVSAQTAASPETVFGLLADGATWPSWTTIESFELEQVGESPPEGVGAIRVFRRGRTTGRDQILELVPNRRVAYASLSGLPVRAYVGEVDLERAAGGGTIIRWHSSFFAKPRGTGWIVERGIRRFLEQCVRGLAEYAVATSDAARDTVDR